MILQIIGALLLASLDAYIIWSTYQIDKTLYQVCVDRGFHRISFTHECTDCSRHVGCDDLPLF